MKKIYSIVSVYLVVLSVITGNVFAGTPSGNTLPPQKSLTGFIENKGQILDQDYQANPGVKYLFSSPGFNVQLRATGFSYDTYTDDSLTYLATSAQDSGLMAIPVGYSRHYHRVDVDLLNCNTSAEMVPEGRSEGYYNYFTTGTPAGGVKFVHAYRRVVYKNIYPEIDLVFYIKSPTDQPVKGIPGVEYDFIVHPGGDANAIRLAYSGANAVNLQNGQLNIQVASGAYAERMPKSYIPQSGQAVDVRYRSISPDVYSFSLPQGFKNNSSDLVIDPTPCLIWGTYYGGVGADYAVRTTVDAAGNSYIGGSSSSTTGIATAGAYRTTFEASMDVYVAKFSASGALLWGSYYGGRGSDLAIGIGTDTASNVYITGSTTSTTGIATAGAYQTTYAGGVTYGDCFVAEFSSTGSTLLWGTYYGGNQDDAGGGGVKVDKYGHVYIGGFTSSTTGIATPGAYLTVYPGGSANAFVAEFNPALTGAAQLVWGTYYGGDVYEHAKGLAIDTFSNVYMTGTTESPGIASAGAYQTNFVGSSDVFVVKFSATGTMLWSTYYGGTSINDGYRIAVDDNQNVFFAGYTYSTTGIATPGAYQTSINDGGETVYIAELNPSGTSLLWGTYYDGYYFGYTVGNIEFIDLAIALDASSNVYVAGGTTTTGQATAGAYQTTLDGSFNVYVAKFNTAAQLIWDTYYGGNNGSIANGIGLDADENIYISGSGNSTTGIATPGAYQGSPAGSTDIFVAKFGCNNELLNALFTAGDSTICTGSQVSFTDQSTGNPTGWNWTFSGGTPGSSASENPTVTYDTAGIYAVKLVVTNSSGADSLIKSGYITVTPAPVAGTVTGPDSICSGSSAQLSETGSTGKIQWQYSTNGASFTALAGDTLSTANIAGLSQTTYYRISAGASCGSVPSAAFKLTVNAPPVPVVTTPDPLFCTGDSTTVCTSQPFASYVWNTGDTSACITAKLAGGYWVTVTDDNGCSAISAQKNIGTYPVTPKPVLTATDSVFCSYDSTQIISSRGYLSYLWNTGDTSLSIYVNQPGAYWVTVTDADGCSAISGKQNIATFPLTTIPVLSANDSAICSYDSTKIISSGSYLSYRWNNGDTTGSIYAGEAGGYAVTVTDVNGCTASSVPKNITVFPVTPKPVITANDSLICSSDSVRITASGSYSSYRWNTGDTTGYTYANQAGGYWVTVTDVNGCTAESGQQEISVYPVPSVSIVEEGDKLSSYGQVGYVWLLNGAPLGGDTSPVIVASQQGFYSVQVTDSNGCTTTSDPVQVTPFGTGVQNLVEENVSIYPNPSAGNWQLAVGNELLGSTLAVYDEQGQIVFNSELETQNSKLDLNVPSGVYYLRISNERGSVVRKLVKIN